MKLLSFPFPDFNGVCRGVGNVGRATVEEAADEGVGERKLERRKPPGSDMGVDKDVFNMTVLVEVDSRGR